MAQVSDAELLSNLVKKHHSLNGVLLFGTEEANIASVSRQVLATLKLEDEPLRLVSASLRHDGAALDDAFRSMSLLGGRQAIVVEGCDEAHLPWLQSVIEAKSIGNFVVMLAGSLNKSSKLRACAAESPMFLTCGFYAETDETALNRIRMNASSRGVSFSEGAAERFLELTGVDRGISGNEFDKLCTYVHPALEISLTDVEASCGDQASFDFDKLIEAVMDGRLEDADRIFDTLRADGEWKQVLVMLQMHLAKLEQVRAALDRGEDLERAFRSTKPPVFFAAQKSIARQVRAFSLEEIVKAQAFVQQAILQSRQLGDLAETIAARATLALSRTARQLRG